MPDPRDLLAAGRTYELGGALPRALQCYQAARLETEEPALLSEAWRHEADVHRTRCEWDLALLAARQAAKIAEAAGLPELQAEGVNAEAAVHQSRGHFQEAADLYRHMLQLASDPRVRGIALQNLGSSVFQLGNQELAEECFRDSIACFRQAGYHRGVVIGLTNSGRVALERQDYAGAARLLAEAEKGARDLGDQELVAMARLNYAEALTCLGDQEAAEDAASAALGHFSSTDNHWRRVEGLRILGEIVGRKGDAEGARLIFTRALELARQIGAEAEVAILERRLAT